ncbi:uncharacterized protein B0T15DRAFT_394431 [Chaetomium strumarium]|uniref:Polyketide synthase n=1 Tax=Chaetomium strumarium TaxID=1170767 RepID=A0AAJ0M3E0_9PEZI|nr:hypothetical protein B0T15DRAFT_394431 [Chaetomium strumarium]
MTGQQTLYLFGDQTFDAQPHLETLLRGRDNPVLEAFLQQTYDALRREIYQLPVEVREALPRLTSLDDLLLWKHGGRRLIALEMALTCLYQLGTFISQESVWGLHPNDTRILGLCTGALAAAAVSCSRSTIELVPLAVDAVVVAFRTGLHVAGMAQRLEAAETVEDESWSVVIPGQSSADAVASFNKTTLLPPYAKPYISAHAPNGITVSGSPRSLRRLLSSDGLHKLTTKSIPIFAPYHAPHLYSAQDVEEILQGLERRGIWSHIPIFSGSGNVVELSSSFEKLLENAVEHILLQPIRWIQILDRLQTHLQGARPKAFQVVALGTRADQLVYTSLKQTSLAPLLSPPPLSPGSQHPDSISYPNPSKPKLAIVGMSGRFPGAQDNEAFWDLLHRGLDMHKEVPPLHWDARTHVDPTGARKNTSITPYGCWLDDPASFDARFFNISPREAPQIDPAQRIALMTAYEAIEQAGIVPDATPSTRRDRVGVFYGVTSQDWFETNSAQNIDTYFIPGGNMAFIPGRINYFFKFSGPSFAVNTACSSSLAAIHLACNSLWRGDIDTAITGGTNILTNPDMTAGLDKGHFLSQTGNCKTFDDGADGYCRGEGVGTVIIKRLDDAIADKDPVLGVILGAYTNHSAESESITRPHVGAQRAVFNKILNQAAVDPYTVGYVEMHGTGTQAGDAGEMSSVLDTFAPRPEQSKRANRTKAESLFLGSAKANIGHGEAASGMSSLIKVLLMMQKDTIVPHCGIKTKINHRFPTDLLERNVHIAREPTRWARSTDPRKPRRAFINNFSAAGGNTALLLEDGPLDPESADSTPADPRSHHVVAVSAKNGTSLQGNLRSLLGYLQRNPDVPLGRLSYTTTARRIHHQHRVMLTGTSSLDLCREIDSALEHQAGMTRPKGSPKVVFAYTGQGAQYPGMGKELFENVSFFRTEMRRLDRMGQALGFASMLPIIQAGADQQDIGQFPTMTVPLASVCMQISLTKLWASWGLAPTAVVGHSLGEYAALNAAGVLSDADTIYLVGTRARLLQEKCTKDTHTMLVVKGPLDEIQKTLKAGDVTAYEVACVNSPVETVLAATNEDMVVVRKTLTDAGIKTTPLKVPYAFHSSQVDPILEEFKTIARNVTYSEAKVPVLCPLDGQVVVGAGVFGPEYLASHTRQPVNMMQALAIANSRQLIPENGVTLEIGPHPAVSGMIKSVLGHTVTSLASCQRGRPAFQLLATTLKTLYTMGADIAWPLYHRDFLSSSKVLPLPAYSWDLKPYWIQYVNDWSLRKGDPPLTITAATKLESTTIHRVVEESGGLQTARIVAESDVARKDFRPLIEGHEVDGVPLCTPAVYTDIALALGRHLLDRYHPEKTTSNSCLEISDMTILKALILRTDANANQVLRVQADADWAANAASVKFMTLDHEKLQEHSHCTVRFNDGSLRKKLQLEVPIIKQKMSALRDGLQTHTTARFNRAMAYRAIRPLARFHDGYRAVEEIVLNSKTLEASSRLSFKDFHKDGHFHTHPGLIDGLTWAAGFSMNCNDYNDLDKDVFVNHGWGSFQVFEDMDFSRDYTTYSRMVEGKDRLWQGEVSVLDGDKIVAHFTKFAMQGVPRRVLRAILNSEKKKPNQLPREEVKPALPRATADIGPRARQNVSSSPTITRAISIIAEESGLAESDLTDGTVFADVGIDSLLGLTITARFKEELDLDLDFNSLFYEYPSIGDLKAFLGGEEPKTTGSTATPSTESSNEEETDISSVSTHHEKAPGLSKAQLDRAIQIISEESGVAREDLTDDSNFSDCGVDSLLSLVIVSRFRDELELDIQHESLFLECPTVADLKQTLGGRAGSEVPKQGGSGLQDGKAGSSQHIDNEKAMENTSEAPRLDISDANKTTTPAADTAALESRKKAIDDYVDKYTAGFVAPVPCTSGDATPYDANAKVVLVTGATGSLGGHLAFQLAHRSDVRAVVCLNREHKTEAAARQKKAMKDKGVHFPDQLLSKLRVLQADTSKPRLGLSEAVYDDLAASVTHVVHQAWPMSVKRPLSGFEPQFAVMRNLVDLASAIVRRRPAGFRCGFQLVSSISVVGNYRGSRVPEDAVGIESLLPVGYAEAKWGCERMLEALLRQHPAHFRAMTVRLGQIAGSSISGYWNPMEHFGFIVRSSQTLNALPDVDGHAYWTPVNTIASALADLGLADSDCYAFYHIENPVGQPWQELNSVLADALGIPNLIPLREWTQRVKAAPPRNNPASALAEFLETNYERMSCGRLVLDPTHALEHSPTLAAAGPVSAEVVRKYVYVWKEIGFLS